MRLPPLPDTPMVSLMLTAYNHERFVVEAVESALAMDWPADRLDIVVLEDGSTDATGLLLESYADRVRLIRQENQGIRAVVNRIMDEMHGDLILAAAGDDVSPRNRIRILVEAMQANPTAGMVYSDQEMIDARGAVMAPSLMDLYELPRPSGRIRGQLVQRNVVSGGACMLRGDLKHVVHPIPDVAPWEDYWWAWAISGVADIVHVPQVTYSYRAHGANVSLGAHGARLAAAQRQEIGFRRWMLTQLRPGEATAFAVLEGIGCMYGMLNGIAQGSETSLPEVLASYEIDTPAADDHVRRGHAALQDGDVIGAAFACAAAAAAAPLYGPAVTLHKALIPLGSDLLSKELFTREVEILADARELIARPELLADYGERFTAEDETTLVIHGDALDQSDLVAELLPLLESEGLDGPDAPDMVLATGIPGGFSALERRASARLGDRPSADLPCALEGPLPTTAADYLVVPRP